MRLRHGADGAFVNVPDDQAERLIAAGFISDDDGKSTAKIKKAATAARRRAAAKAAADAEAEAEPDTDTPEPVPS